MVDKGRIFNYYLSQKFSSYRMSAGDTRNSLNEGGVAISQQFLPTVLESMLFKACEMDTKMTEQHKQVQSYRDWDKTPRFTIALMGSKIMVKCFRKVV